MKLENFVLAAAFVAGSMLTASPNVALAASVSTSRNVICSMNQVPNMIATLAIENENGVDALKSITLTDLDDPTFKQDHTIDGVYNIPDVVPSSLYQNSKVLQDYVSIALTKKSVAFDSLDLMLVKSEQDTPEQILESIADDLSGLMYVEARSNGQFTGAFLLAGWAGLFVNCTQQ